MKKKSLALFLALTLVMSLWTSGTVFAIDYGHTYVVSEVQNTNEEPSNETESSNNGAEGSSVVEESSSESSSSSNESDSDNNEVSESDTNSDSSEVTDNDTASDSDEVTNNDTTSDSDEVTDNDTTSDSDETSESEEAPEYEDDSDYAEAPEYEDDSDYSEAPEYEDDSDYAEVPEYEDDSDYAEVPEYEDDSDYSEAPECENDSDYTEVPEYEDDSDYTEAPEYEDDSDYTEAPEHEEDSDYAEVPEHEDDSDYAEVPEHEEDSDYAETPEYEDDADYEDEIDEEYPILGEEAFAVAMMEFVPFNAPWVPGMPLPDDRPLDADELLAWRDDFCASGCISPIELEIWRLTNLEREIYGLPPLALNRDLFMAARFKSQEMMDLQYFAHASPVYGQFDVILQMFSQGNSFWGENLGTKINWQVANITAQSYVTGWMNSTAGHRESILNSNFTSFGAGVVTVAPGGMGFNNSYGTQMFGTVAVDCTCPLPSLPPLPVMSIVSVSPQDGSITEGYAGIASFTLVTENVRRGRTIELNLPSGVTGITLSTTRTGDGTNTVYVNTTQVNIDVADNVPAGNHSLTFTIAGVESQAFTLVVDEDPTQQPTDPPVQPPTDPPVQPPVAPPWIPGTPLPDRRLTDEERQAWIADYFANGGPTAVELEVLRLVNIERASRSLEPVAVDYSLMAAARYFAQQANDLRGLYTGSHTFGPYGTSRDVAAAFGGNLRWTGGNWFSGGTMSAEEVVNGWMNSDGHRNYILSPEHRFLGMGQFPGGISYLFMSADSGSLTSPNPPNQPPTDPPTQPPTDPPTQPPTDPPTQPPTDPPTQPPHQPQPPQQPPGGSFVGGGGGSATTTWRSGNVVTPRLRTAQVRTLVPVNAGGISINTGVTNAQANINVTIGAVNRIIANAVDNKVVFDFSQTTETVSTVSMTTFALVRFAAADLDIEIRLPNGTVTLDTVAINSILRQGSGNIVISVVPATGLTVAQRSAIASGEQAFRVSVQRGTQVITNFDGTVTVTIPFEGPFPVVAWLIDDAGERQSIPAVYDEVAETVTVTTFNLAVVVIGSNAP